MATRTISNAGGNFNSTGTWVEGIVPVAGDAVVATATSGNLTVNVASGGVGLLSFNMTSYTGVLTMNNTLTIAGTMTLVSGMGIIAGTSAIICNTTATLTSGGKVIPQLSLAGTSQTYTLADNFQVGVFTNASATTLVTLNGNTLSVSGDVTITRALAGTTNLVYNTSTTQSINVQSCSLTTQTINAAGTITITTYGLTGGTLTYTAGTVITTSSTLSIGTGNCTINTGTGVVWNNVTIVVSPVITLLSDLNINGTFTNSNNVPQINGLFNVNISGSLTMGGGNLSGTSTIILKGTGTWSGSGIISNNLTFNTAGTITISGTVGYNTGTLTYTSGTVVAKGSTLNLGTTTLINCHKINFDTVTITSGNTITMNEFFSGSPNQPVKVQASSAATNYTITFQNGFEKIAKYVKISNLTLTNTVASRGGLLILNNKGKYFTGGNNVGNIRYINQSPNGISKGNPSVPNPMTSPIGGYVSDPIFN